jgi:hypothetical protein
MTEQQQKALDHLGRLTETGRGGGDPSAECMYEVGGKDNGIQLFQMGVTDADMRQFALLPEWHSINLRECPVSDTGFKYLANQTALRVLDVGETKVTTLHPVRECIHVQQLWCDRLEQMTDRKAAALANFRELRFLDLAWTDIGNVTADQLASLTELRKLNLLGTKITGEGLQAIGTLPKLEMLSFYPTAVTDEGLLHLHGLSQLRRLTVGETQLTKKGRSALRKARPSVKVEEYASIY